MNTNIGIFSKPRDGGGWEGFSTEGRSTIFGTNYLVFVSPSVFLVVHSLLFSGKENVEKPEDIAERIHEFTSRFGREKGWIDRSIDKLIEAASKSYPDDYLAKMHLARFAIYRHSSEVIHGTLFGIMHFFGQTMPTAKKSDRSSLERGSGHMGEQHVLLLMATALCVVVAVESFCRKYSYATGLKEIKDIQNLMGNLDHLVKNKPS